MAAMLLALAVVATAQACAKRTNDAPRPVEGQPNTDSVGDFSALQIATTDTQALLKEWAKPTPGVSLKTSTTARRNQPIETFIIFKGCQADTSGVCNVTADFEVVDPAGEAYERALGAKVWVGRPPPPGLNLQLSVSSLQIDFDDDALLGPYRVRATITDHVAGVSVQTEQVLTAVPD